MVSDNIKEVVSLIDEGISTEDQETRGKYYELIKWMEGVKPSTRRQYGKDMEKYQGFTKMNAKRLIDEAEADLKKDRRSRGKPEERIKAFYNHLIDDSSNGYEKLDKHGRPTGEFGIGAYSARGIVGNIKGFYISNGFRIQWKIPKSAPKKENRRIELSPKDIRKLLNVTLSNRDKSLIMTGYQGGFDADSVRRLDIGDLPRGFIDTVLGSNGEIEKAVSKIKPPIQVHVVREKEGVDYITCLGHDAVYYLALQLWDRYNINGETLTPEKPLYIMGTYNGSQKKNPERRITTNTIQKMMRVNGIKAGIIDKNIFKRADINPAGYHALRGSFSKRLEYAGMQKTYINYMQGHVLDYGGAYDRPNPGKLLDSYQEYSHVLNVSEAPLTYSEIEEKLAKQIERQDMIIKGLEDKISKLEQADGVFLKLFKHISEKNPDLLTEALKELG